MTTTPNVERPQQQQVSANPSTSSLCRPWLTPSSSEAVCTRASQDTSGECHSQAHDEQSLVSLENAVHHSSGSVIQNLDSFVTFGATSNTHTSPSPSVESCLSIQRTVDSLANLSNFDAIANTGRHKNDTFKKKKHKHKEGYKKKKKHKEKKTERYEGRRARKHKDESENLLAESIGTSPEQTTVNDVQTNKSRTEYHLMLPSSVQDGFPMTVNSDPGSLPSTVAADIHSWAHTNSTETTANSAFTASSLVAKNSSDIPIEHLPPRKRHKIYMETISTYVPNDVHPPSFNTDGVSHVNNALTSHQDADKEISQCSGSLRDLNGLTLLAAERARQQAAGLTPSSTSTKNVLPVVQPSENSSLAMSLTTTEPTGAEGMDDTQTTRVYSCKPVSLSEELNTERSRCNTSSADFGKQTKNGKVTANRINESAINQAQAIQVHSTGQAQETNDQLLPRNQTVSTLASSTLHSAITTPSALMSHGHAATSTSNNSSSNLTRTSSLTDTKQAVSLPSLPSIFTFSNLSKVTYTTGLYLPSTVRMSSAVSTPGMRSYSPTGSNGSNLSTTTPSTIGVDLNQQASNHAILPPVNGLNVGYHARPQQFVQQNMDSKIPYPQPSPIMNPYVTIASALPKARTAIIPQKSSPSSIVSQISPVTTDLQYIGTKAEKPSLPPMPSQHATATTDLPPGVITIPVTLNGITIQPSALQGNQPHRPEPIRPPINSNILQYQQNGPAAQQNHTALGIIGVRNPAESMSSNYLSIGEQQSGTISAQVLPQSVILPSGAQAALPTTHTLSTPLSATSGILPGGTFVPNATTSVSSVLPATIVSSSTASGLVSNPSLTSLPRVDGCLDQLPSQMAQTYANGVPLVNVPTATVTQQYQAPFQLVADQSLPSRAGGQPNSLTLPLNSTLSTIDASEITLSTHINGNTFPLNGTVREAIDINTTVLAGQYNNTFAPLKRAPGRTQLDNHISSGVPVGETSFLCDVCNKVFPLERFLKRHMRCHNAVKKYHCAYCSKGFNDTFDLKRHVRTHTGVRPYKCDECGKAFTQRCSLEAHINKVHGKNSNYSFKQRRSKMYVCEECGHTTTIADQHYDHIKESHPESGELRKYQDKQQLKKLVMDSSSSSGEGSSSIPTLSLDQESNDGFASNLGN